METRNDLNQSVPGQLLGKPFGATGLQMVVEESALASPQNRAEIARRVCRRLNWKSPGGQYQYMSARVALLRLHRAGLVELPEPTCGNGNGQKWTAVRSLLPPIIPIELPVHKLKGLELVQVKSRSQSESYNNLMAQYHYLGYTPLAGAQIRYLIQWEQGLLGAIGFGASAWKLAARDQWVGWTAKQRQQGLHLIVNNSRFLILPYVHSPNLASKTLSMASRRLGRDYQKQYGYTPVLLETFVEVGRFTGDCYRAANWMRLGRTTGRGKKHQRGEPRGPLKEIWVYPIHRNYRKLLHGRAFHG